MLLNGGFSPLTGFLGKEDYQSVLKNNRLSNNTVWPIPITLDVSEEFSKDINTNDKIVLRDHEGIALGILNITDKWLPDRKKEAEMVYGSIDELHPAVNYLLKPLPHLKR